MQVWGVKRRKKSSKNPHDLRQPEDMKSKWHKNTTWKVCQRRKAKGITRFALILNMVFISKYKPDCSPPVLILEGEVAKQHSL